MMKFIRKKVNEIVDAKVQEELKNKREWIEELHAKEEAILKELHITKLASLNELIMQLNIQIEETKRVRIKSEEEQKLLWERLDILRDNLNSEQVWLKIWEMAYSKATDKVWEIMKSETTHLIELAKKNTYNQAVENLSKIYEQKIADILKNSTEKVNVALLLDKKEEFTRNYLTCQRGKDKERENYFQGKIDLIEELLNGQD